MPLGIGLHFGISHEDYHGDPCEVPSLSSHLAGIIVNRSAAHGYHAHPRLGAGKGSKFTRATAAGSIIHGLVLGGAQGIEVIDAQNYRKKETQTKRDDAEAAGRIPILAREYTQLEVVARTIRNSLPAFEESEATGVWSIGDGHLARSRFDFLEDDRSQLHDLKTCDDCVAASQGAAIVRYGYHIQAAAYLECMRSLFPEVEGRQQFILHFREIVAPFAGIDAVLDGQLLELGQRQWNRAKARWIEGMINGTWPNPASGIRGGLKRIECPQWALTQDMNNQSDQLTGGSDVCF